jgi:hypothetical protein
VPAHFWQAQDTFALSRTVLTAKFSFGVSRTLLAPPILFWKAQNIRGTVPALLAPLFLTLRRSNPVNTGIPYFLPL